MKSWKWRRSTGTHANSLRRTNDERWSMLKTTLISTWIQKLHNYDRNLEVCSMFLLFPCMGYFRTSIGKSSELAPSGASSTWCDALAGAQRIYHPFASVESHTPFDPIYVVCSSSRKWFGSARHILRRSRNSQSLLLWHLEIPIPFHNTAFQCLRAQSHLALKYGWWANALRSIRWRIKSIRAIWKHTRGTCILRKFEPRAKSKDGFREVTR